MHKTIVFFLFICLCAMSASAEDGDMARLEARYTAHFKYESETRKGDYTETGKVVYYLPRTGDKKARAMYDVYPERIVDNISDTIVVGAQPRIEVLKSLWPVPAGGTGDKSCVVDTVGGTTTLTYNLKDNLDADSEKVCRIMGLNMDIDSAVVTSVLGTLDITKVSPLEIRSLSEKLEVVLNGRMFRKMYGGAAKGSADINIVFDESAELVVFPKKEAKKMRKREQAEWKSTHKELARLPKLLFP